MGVLTDFVVANAEQAEEVLHSSVPSASFPGIAAKGIDAVKLATLQALLTNTELNLHWSPELVAEANEQEQLLFVVPRATVEMLGALDEGECQQIGNAWANTEEFQRFERWDPTEVIDLLTRLSALARLAAKDQKTLFMWMST